MTLRWTIRRLTRNTHTSIAAFIYEANITVNFSGEIRQKKVTVDHWYEEKLVIIKDVPVGVCQECGQRYYAAATLDRLDNMAQNSDTAPERISVPVMVMNL